METRRPQIHLDHAVVNSFLRGLSYPLDRGSLISIAKANGLFGEYLDAFRLLPDRTFESQDEIMDELRRRGTSLR